MFLRPMTLALANSVLRVLLALAYRVEVRGLENLEAAGPRRLIVPQHVSAIDSLVVRSHMPAPPVLAVNPDLVRIGWMRRLMELGFARYHALGAQNPLAIRDLAKDVVDGHAVMVFPEGRMSVTGTLMRVHEGAALIADLAKAVVVPVRLEGLYASRFSRRPIAQGRRRWFPKVKVTFLAPRELSIPGHCKGRARRAAATLRLYDVMSDMLYETAIGQGSALGLLRTAAQGSAKRSALFGAETSAADLAGEVERFLGVFEVTVRPGCAVVLLCRRPEQALPLYLALRALGARVVLLDPDLADEAIITAGRATDASMVVVDPIEDVDGRQFEHLALSDLAVIRPNGPRRYGRPRDLPASGAPAAIFWEEEKGERPRAVAHAAEGLLALSSQILARLDIHTGDVVLNLLPLHKALGLSLALHLPLLAGARTLTRAWTASSDIARTIYLSGITVLFAPAGVLRALGQEADPYELRSLRHVVCAGSDVSEATRAIFSDRFGLRILQSHGAGETMPLLSLSTPLYFDRSALGRVLPRVDVDPPANDGEIAWARSPAASIGVYDLETPGLLQPPPTKFWAVGAVSVVGDGFLRAAEKP